MGNELVPHMSEGEIVQSTDIEACAQRINDALQRIDQRNRRNLKDAVLIGQELHAVKAQLQHGEFGGWLNSHFDMSRTEATRFMQVATLFADKLSTMDNLPSLTVSYLLAQGTTPDSVREAVFSGEIPATISAVREALKIGNDSPQKALHNDIYQELEKHGVSLENIGRMYYIIAEAKRHVREGKEFLIWPTFLDFKEPPNWERDYKILLLIMQEIDPLFAWEDVRERDHNRNAETAE